VIDFDALIGPAVYGAFARPISVTPLVSQPGQPAYTAKGIWRVEHIDIETESGIYSGKAYTLDIHLADFAIPPAPKDKVSLPAHLSMPTLGPLWIDNTFDDSVGISRKLWLKEAGA
jgi:hypothetical protein